MSLGKKLINRSEKLVIVDANAHCIIEVIEYQATNFSLIIENTHLHNFIQDNVLHSYNLRKCMLQLSCDDWRWQ